MNENIGRMQTLTAEIAESLLSIKDTGGGVTPELACKTGQLHQLAQDALAQADDGTCAHTGQTPPSACDVAETHQPCLADMPSDEATATDTPETDSETVSLTVIEKTSTSSEPQQVSVITAGLAGEDTTAGPDAKMLREAMSLNDTFLFRRTLFGGSAERFNNALAAIAGMSRISEAREYMSRQLGINLKSTEAREFVSIIAPFLEND